MRFTKRTLIIGMFLASSGIASCGEADTNDSDLGIEQIAGDGTHLLVGDYTNLTAVEMAEYIEDRQYMRSLAQPDQAVHLNLADPQMYRLAMNRLKISGKTPANSPQLYTAMERTRSEHVLRGYGTGLVAQMQFRSEGDGREAMHFISTAVVAGDAGEGAASSTFPEGSDYTFLDVGYYDGADVPLAAPNIIEQFGGGTDVNVQTGADLTVSELDSYTVDTFQLEDSAAGFGASYVYTTMGLQGAQPAARPTPPVLIIDDVTAPADIAHNDGIVSICLNRAWTGDCDYDLTGNPQSVKVPLQGSIEVVSAAHRFSAGAIDDIRADLAAATPNPRSGYVKLLLADAGGGCDVEADGALQTNMAVFWDNATLTPDQKTLTWDLSGANSAFFDDGCRQVQDAAYLTIRLQLPVRDITNNLDYWVSKTLSNNPDQFAPDYVYDPIKITNSCLAAGTMLQMANGRTVAVEDIESGDHVFSSLADGAQGLTVTDTAVGFETEPMVRLHADSGQSVLMTEMHPVLTPDRGIVIAKALKEGDLVLTSSGVSILSSVDREEFGGKVYNVKLGTSVEKAALGAEDATLVYANGFLVGDGQVQSKYETIARAADKQGPVIARLPTDWQLDYVLANLRD